MTPSLCGNNLSDKRSLVAFTWTVTTLLTIIAFMVSLGMIINVHAQYNWHSSYSNNNSNRYLEGGGGDGDGHGSGDNHHSGDGSGDNNKNGEHNEEYAKESFTQSKSGGMSFVAFYLMMVAMGLSLYGTTAIVGFTSLHGDYIAPCFSSTTSSSMKLGMFGGAIILYANVLLVCAVFFGEITVVDNRDNDNENADAETEIERIAAILGVTCMFLAALYSIFSVLLFLFFGSIEGEELDEDGIIGTKPLKSISNDPRRENFITLGEPS